jgi:hypothetical protein
VILSKWELLRKPYEVMVKRPADVVIHGEPMRVLQGNHEEIPRDIVFLGRILDPLKTEEYLREQLES